MNKKIITTVSAVSLATLSACGGGGGDSSSKPQPAPTPLSITASSTALNANELESANTNISLTNASGTVTTSNNYSGGGSVSTTINGNEIEVNFTSPDVENNIEEGFTVSVSDADETKTLTFTANITNTSGDMRVTDISIIKTALEQQNYFAEISHIFTTYNKMAILTSVYSQAMANSYNAQFNDALTSAKTAVTAYEITPESIQTVVDNYNANTLTETELSVTLNDAMTLLNEQSLPLLSSINDIANQSDKLPQLPELNYQVNSSLSPFTGNTLYGDWFENTWQYKAEFSIIESMLTSTCLAQ
jgi:predicted transglutaminase-like cysteine proteinase